MVEPVVELLQVTKSYGRQVVLDGIDLAIERGEFLTLLGPSGCGKTTILRLIAGFEAPTGGRIKLEGADVTALPPNRRQVNTVFQSYALFPHLSVYENVAFGPRLAGEQGEALDGKVKDALATVQLEDYARRRPSQLSGGQQQRVAIARAIVNRPSVLLLDEPLSALDYKLRKAMQLELKQLQRRLGITFVFVTHDQEEALSMSDRVVVMDAGRIQQIGPPRSIYETPANLFVAGFVGEINLLPAVVRDVGAEGVEVTLEGHRMRLPVGTAIRTVPHEGDAVFVGVRPEDLRIWRQVEVTDELRDTLFPATIDEVIYKGSTVDLQVRLASSGTRLATTQFFNEDDPAITELDFAAGEAVYVSWVPGWEVVLPNAG
jgi:spermidine/putrescine transport system ATP-binding protein